MPNRSKEVDFGNPVIAYILGVLHGDGSAYIKPSKSYRVQLRCTIDKGFADSFAEALRDIGATPWIGGPYNLKIGDNSRFPDGRTPQSRQPRWCVEASSKPLVLWYRQAYYPRDVPNAIKNTENFLDTAEKIRLYLKGFYESEGCVTESRIEQWKYYPIRIYNSNVELLGMVARLLKKCGYNPAPKIAKHGDWEHVLNLQRRSLDFLEWINPATKKGPNVY